MTLGGSFGHVEATTRVFMERTLVRSQSGLTHAVPEHEGTSLCGVATAGRSAALWPAVGQSWPAGPSRCPACANLMSEPRV